MEIQKKMQFLLLGVNGSFYWVASSAGPADRKNGNAVICVDFRWGESAEDYRQ